MWRIQLSIKRHSTPITQTTFKTFNYFTTLQVDHSHTWLDRYAIVRIYIHNIS